MYGGKRKMVMMMKKRKTMKKKPMKKMVKKPELKVYKVRSQFGVGFVRATSRADAIKKLMKSSITARF